MPWMPDIPHDQGTQPQGSLTPYGVVAHRTYGSWNGDYGVGKGNKPPVGFHFLIGKAEGRWVQFYSTDTRCAHAGTNQHGNDVSVGIEIEGTNTDVMTDWQVERCGQILRWLHDTHGIALDYRFSTAHNLTANAGVIPHSAVKGADHSDYWTQDDWARIVGDDMPSPEEVAWAVWSLAPTNDYSTWTTLANSSNNSNAILTRLDAIEARLAELETGDGGDGGSHVHETGPPVSR
jgi:hypothetical protein